MATCLETCPTILVLEQSYRFDLRSQADSRRQDHQRRVSLARGGALQFATKLAIQRQRNLLSRKNTSSDQTTCLVLHETSVHKTLSD